MANTFKLKTLDGSAIAANTASTVYTSPAATIYVTVLIDNADGDNINFLKSVPIPTGSSIEVMAGNKVNLETGDIIKVKSDVANSLDTCLSIMEQT